MKAALPIPALLLAAAVVGGAVFACGGEDRPAGGPAAATSAVEIPLVARLGDAGVEAASVKARPIEVDGEVRVSILARAPARLRLREVPVAEGAVLRFGTTFHPGRRGGADVDLAVKVAPPGGQAEEVWSRRVAAPAGVRLRTWEDTAVPLAAYAGQRVDLVLEATAVGARDGEQPNFVVWGDPVVASEAPPAVPPRPVERRRLVRQLDTATAEAGRELVVDLRPGAELEVAGELTRRHAEDTGTAASVAFRVRVAGEVAVERSLGLGLRVSNFSETVRLDRWGESGRMPVRLEIDVPEELRGRVRATWPRTALFQRQPVARQAAGDAPNVLLLMVDTLRADHLGTYGYGRDTSPVLDDLAARSLLFERAISQSSWTLPATASVLTGLYPPSHRTYNGRPLAEELETLAERAQDRGLTTFGISANPIVGRAEGFDQGFETFSHLLWARAEEVNQMLLRLLATQAAGQRWFGYVHYIDPHDPYTAPEPYGSRWTAGYDGEMVDPKRFKALVDSVNFDRGDVAYDQADVDYLVGAYDGEIAYWDHHLGRLLEALEERDLLENTVVVVTADHGDEFLEHGLLYHGWQLYDESVHVPLLIHATGLEPRRVEATVETRALAGLVTRLLDQPRLDAAADGEAWVDLLRARRGAAFSHTTHGVPRPDGGGRSELAAVRDPAWKLIHYPGLGWTELYDLQNDPGERRDLAAEEPGRAAEYSDLLDGWLRTTRQPPRASQERDEALLDELRALGYIQ